MSHEEGPGVGIWRQVGIGTVSVVAVCIRLLVALALLGAAAGIFQHLPSHPLSDLVDGILFAAGVALGVVLFLAGILMLPSGNSD
jgi:hypothetical protein